MHTSFYRIRIDCICPGGSKSVWNSRTCSMILLPDQMEHFFVLAGISIQLDGTDYMMLRDVTLPKTHVLVDLI